MCLKNGITAVHTNDEEAWELYQELQKERQMPVRVYLTPMHTELRTVPLPPPGTTEGLLNCHRLYFFSLMGHWVPRRRLYEDRM